MRRRPGFTIALLIAVATATAWCFSIMLGQRFSSGEVYAPGSTKRSDPMGAKALYDAVDLLDGVSCERNFRRLAKLSKASDTGDESAPAVMTRKGQTLMLLNVSPFAFDDGDALSGDVVLDFAMAGGRVVIAASRVTDALTRVMESAEDRRRELAKERREKQKEESGEGKDDAGESKDDAPKADEARPGESKPEEDKPKKKQKKNKDTSDDMPFAAPRSLREALQVDLDPTSLKEDKDGDGYALSTPEGLALLQGSFPPWLSRATLELNPKDDSDSSDPDKAKKKIALKEPWKVLATVEDKPVLAERKVSQGSVVVASDSYFATNQALLMHPAPEFLGWLIGGAKHVIFDETHLGTQENPGIVTMAKRYRMHGFFFGGVLLFVLFVWQSSSSLVPARDQDHSSTRTIAGQGAVAGLVSLLRRGVPRARLLRTCFEQWERNHPHPGTALRARIERAREILPPPEVKRMPRGMLVTLYQRLCETLHPNRH